ncbi:repressor LexA [Weissella viridescens]|uniref:transcriptional repressor LexA n=1 Tax=Weissella viridescens TaxID=1629 RepID=UPI001747C858|nr:transcriptional repressor LexA [Weissella viridescens]QOD85634.1 repressor LexA [Weissella viridescens]
MAESNQIAILRYIHEQQTMTGYAPTVREIAEHVHLASTATVHGHINRLIKKGLLTKKATKSRSFHVTPSGLRVLEQAPASLNMVPRFDPDNNIENQDHVDYIPVPEQLIADQDAFFIVAQQNETMIELGILPGDMLIVHRQDTAQDGDIILVDLPEHPKQVYRFFHEADHFRLEPENTKLTPVISRSLTILGKVKSLYRPNIQ